MPWYDTGHMGCHGVVRVPGNIIIQKYFCFLPCGFSAPQGSVRSQLLTQKATSARDSSQYSLLVTRAQQLVAEKRYEEAAPVYEQILQITPNSIAALNDLGVLYARQNKDDSHAQAELEAAVRLDPSQADAHYRLAEVYRAEGKPQLAAQQLREVSGIHQRKEQNLLREISGSPQPSNEHGESN